MTTKEAVPKSTQSKRNPLTSACPTTSATRPLLLVIYRFFIGVFVGADYPIATSLITEFTPQAPPRDIHGHGLGGVVFGRYCGCSQEEPKHKTGFAEVFSKGYAARIVFLGILTLCQVVPMYAIYTFGPQIMCAFGLGVGKSAILDESVLSLFFLAGSLPAMFWLNSMGRRPLLIRSLFLMAVGLLALGLFPTAPFSR